MKIACLSDLHGNLPEVEDCDLVILAGDLCPFGSWLNELAWLNSLFREWLENLSKRGMVVVGVAGNHDSIFETNPNMVPSLAWHYLEDREIIIDGVRIWGSPWSLPYGHFAFMRDEIWLEQRYANIPDKVDIVINHGPPYRYGDIVPKGGVLAHQGSQAFLQAIDRVQPKLVVFGHIHEGRGIYERGDMLLCNATIWDHVKERLNPPIIIHIDKWSKDESQIVHVN